METLPTQRIIYPVILGLQGTTHCLHCSDRMDWDFLNILTFFYFVATLTSLPRYLFLCIVSYEYVYQLCVCPDYSVILCFRIIVDNCSPSSLQVKK